MPRTRRPATSLAVVQTQIGRMQAALAKLQVEIARLRRAAVGSLSSAGGRTPATLQEARQAVEREVIVRVGEDCRWSRSGMARALRIDRKSLYRKLRKYGLAAAYPSPLGRPSRTAAKPARRAQAGRRR